MATFDEGPQAGKGVSDDDRKMFPVADNFNIISTFDFTSESNKLKLQDHAYSCSFVLILNVLVVF